MHLTTSAIASASWIALLSLFASTPAFASPESTSDKVAVPPEKTCSLHSPLTGSFYDLNGIALSPPELKDGKKINEKDRDESWHAKGYDYGANFTINFCAPVIEEIKDVVGVPESRWANVSAYYESGGKIYSIGQASSEPIFRGRKLVMNYTDGSPCPTTPQSSLKSPRKLVDGDEDEPVRRKNTLIDFLCDRDPLAPAAAVSFVGSPDSCSYFFEVRSSAACGGIVRDTQEGLGPASVFGVIFLITIAVYLIGGCAYQRSVMHQRGWRQCPNYNTWAGIASFIGDMAVIAGSTLSRALPLHLITGRSRDSGYSRVGANGAGGSGGLFGGRGNGSTRGRTNDDENRLIDQLDEEWDD